MGGKPSKKTDSSVTGGSKKATGVVVTQKPWGHEELLVAQGTMALKRLVVKPGSMLSYQHHNKKREIFYIESGVCNLRLEKEEKVLNKRDTFYLPAGAKHQIINKGELYLKILEFSEPYDDGDLVRLEDPWDRK